MCFGQRPAFTEKTKGDLAVLAVLTVFRIGSLKFSVGVTVQVFFARTEGMGSRDYSEKMETSIDVHYSMPC